LRRYTGHSGRKIVKSCEKVWYGWGAKEATQMKKEKNWDNRKTQKRSCTKLKHQAENRRSPKSHKGGKGIRFSVSRLWRGVGGENQVRVGKVEEGKERGAKILRNLVHLPKKRKGLKTSQKREQKKRGNLKEKKEKVAPANHKVGAVNHEKGGIGGKKSLKKERSSRPSGQQE